MVVDIVLGPSFLLLYLNDISEVLYDCTYLLFCDDISIFISGTDLQAVMYKMTLLLDRHESG